jgi:hypothetical protein
MSSSGGSMKKLVLLSILMAMLALGCAQPQPEQAAQTPTPAPTTPSAFPIYKGSKAYTAPAFYYQLMGIPAEGVTVEVYYVEDARVREVLEWYRERMSDYEIISEIRITTVKTPQGSAEWGGVLFRKGNEAVGIWAMSGVAVEGGKGCVYYVVRGPAEVFAEEVEREQLPASDQASGEEPISRYPGSVMVSYYKDTSDPLRLRIEISYGTGDDAAKVAEWYKQLQNKGWTLESESSDEYGFTLYLTKGGESLDIYVAKPSETVAYTEISITYSKTGLPSKDVVSGEEPVKRYPASIMLEHTVMTIAGGKMVTITYGSREDAKIVFEWYNTMLKSDGWQIMSSSTGETFSLSAVKKNAILQLEIKKNAYTEITLMYTAQ